MYNIRPTTKFQKDLKRIKKRGYDISLLTAILKKLAEGEPLPREKQRSSTFRGCMRDAASAISPQIGC